MNLIILIKHIYSEEEINFIRENVKGISLDKLTELFNEKFGLDIKKYNIAYIKRKYSLYSGFNSSRFTQDTRIDNRNYYTQDEIDFIKENIEGMSLDQLTQRFNDKFGHNVSKFSIANIKHKFNLKSRVKKVGHITKYKNGELYIKVEKPSVWRLYKYVVYENHYGVKIKKNERIIFLDGDKSNVTIDNMVKVPYKEQILFSKCNGQSKIKELTQANLNIAKITSTLLDKTSAIHDNSRSRKNQR